MYPQELKLFPIDEDWATGDEHLDKKLNSLLLNCFLDLSLSSIQIFFDDSRKIKTRVSNPSFYLVIELCTKALIGLYNSELEVDQEMIKIKGRINEFEKSPVKIKLEMVELQSKKYQRFFSAIDIFQRQQLGFEQNPFVSFKLKKSEKYYEIKIIYKELIDRLSNSGEQKFDHELFELLSKKNTVEIEQIGRIWFNRGMIFCVND